MAKQSKIIVYNQINIVLNHIKISELIFVPNLLEGKIDNFFPLD